MTGVDRRSSAAVPFGMASWRSLLSRTAGPAASALLGALAGCTVPLPLLEVDAAMPRDAGGVVDSSSDATSPIDAPAPMDAGAADATTPDAGPPDAGTPRCLAGTAFRPPTLVADLSDMLFDDDGLTVSSDELEALVRSGAENTFFIHTRPSVGSSFGPGAPSGVNLVNEDAAPFLDATGLELFFASTRDLGGATAIYRSVRATRAGSFAAPVRVTLASPLPDASDPYLVGSTLYFSATGPSRGRGIFSAPRTGDTAFGTPMLLTALDSGNEDRTPVVSEDGLEIFFARNGAGAGDDIVTATRAATSDSFGPPAPADALRSPNQEWPEALSRDGCRLYLVSNRSGRWDVYVASRSTP